MKWLRAAFFCAFMGLPAGASAQTQDIPALLQAAESGEATAQYELAERFRAGDGMLQNYASAAKWYRAAADQGEARAQNALGALMISGLGIGADQEAGFALLQQAAKSGAPNHVYDLASAYEQGVGTAVDMGQAIALFEQSASSGFLPAQVSLAVIYHLGQGVAPDLTRAIELYEGAAKAGHPRALNNLGMIFARGEGVKQDYTRAAELFTRAAEQGLPEAMKNLGAIYENGFGVNANEEEAKRLYRLAAQSSTAEIGFLYDPRLQPVDPALIETYQNGAKQGDPLAQFMLAYLLVISEENGSNMRLAASLFADAADKGLPAAMANLGVLTFKGQGVLQDYVEGYKWLTLAALSAPSDVIAIRDALAQRMTVDQINAANALAEEYLSKSR